MNNGAYRVNTTSPIESTAAWSRQRRFEAVVRIYSADLYRFGYWLCHDQVLAEDLVQETFMRAWNSLDNLRDAKATRCACRSRRNDGGSLTAAMNWVESHRRDLAKSSTRGRELIGPWIVKSRLRRMLIGAAKKMEALATP